jgi:hypothetical protein
MRRSNEMLITFLVSVVVMHGIAPRVAAQESGGSEVDAPIPPPPADTSIPPPPAAQPTLVFVPTQAPQPTYIQPYQPTYVAAQPEPAPARRGGARIGLIVSGAVLLGVGWLSNIIVGIPAGENVFGSGSEEEWEAFRYCSIIPVVGPWVQLGVKPTAFSQDGWAIWLILNGVMQAAGTALLVSGIALSDDGNETADADSGPSFAVLPNISPNHAGLSLFGSF